MRFGFGDDQVDGIVREGFQGKGDGFVNGLNVDGDAAEAIHQGVLEEGGDDAEAVVLAHQHVGHVSVGLARPLLLAGRQRREGREIVGAGEDAHQARHDRFDHVGELRGHHLGAALLLDAEWLPT